ncbi:proteoglycan 4-like isoform X2 [Alosa sapidissima]|uniref:proteoglycan 4-like isoform X2 n=1 Tax=Alosa sapidissima TaxID=34773 RepID=UPI001C090CF6|nr:proteoglycan 4-like isoform X2 [Alosa sapidissima]
MSKDERTSVLRTTKVRTAIKGDSSWIQRRTEAEPEEEEDKPWLAEVRANRLNGAPTETSPVSSPTTKEPASTDTTQSTKSATSGYLISAPAPTSNFTKKPSEVYKKIAPHTVRPSTEPTVQTEPQLSPEEVEKRTEAASGVLQNTKAARQRSYVLSAAKKYESTSKPESPPESTTTSFVAKRVEISDDEADTPQEPVSPPPAPVKRVSAPEPTPPPPTLPEPTPPPPTLPEPTPPPPTLPEPTPPPPTLPTPPPPTLPEPTPPPPTLPEPTPPPPTLPEPTPPPPTLPEPTPPPPTLPTPPPPTLPEPTPPPPTLPEPTPPPPTLPEPTPPPPTLPEPTPPPPTLPASVKKEFPPVVVTPKPLPQERIPEPPAEQSAETLSALSDTLISFNTEHTSPKQKQEVTPVVDLISSPVKDRITHTKPVLFEETKTVETSVVPEPIPEPSSDLHNDDLVSLAQSGDVEQVDTPPSSPPAWSQDLLGPESFPAQTKKTTGALDLLADDVIPIDTKRTSLSSTDDLLSPTETITITTKTTIITEDSSVDPFDPFPKETMPIKSPVKLFDVLNTKTSSPEPVSPPSPIPDDSMPTDALVSLADDVIPIDTNTTRLITNRDWERFDTKTESEEEEEPAASAEMVSVRYERKSTDNDSPWDKWTSPTVYTTKTEESTIDADQESTSSDSEKKGIVLLKEYVDDKRDYSTHSSLYDYSRDGNMSACTYCGELVGSDAKITIEHLNISCHPTCFKCAICSSPMGDLLFSMFLHNGMVHCETCYANVI